VRAEAGWKPADKRGAHQKASMQWRAGYWYRQALPHLSGITLDKVAERVKHVDDQPPPFRVTDALGEVLKLKHKLPVTWMTLAPDGKRVPSSSQDGLIREWNLATGKMRVIINPQQLYPQQTITHFAFSPDEKHVAIGSPKGFRIWDLATYKPGRFMAEEKEAVPGMFWPNVSTVCYFNKDFVTRYSLNGTGYG